ncbi:TetR family transcriptional regulator [Sphaerimonospora sp. CA-214678]|uniref:TetR/AcrR family transcriptional regulator n=1 Tax=Sphaerimonospora sp. CA-214678 TaxID=3240029 RepID=UPI003D8A6F62
MNKAPRRGRRVGNPDTRAQILDVARRRFLEGGYQAVTLRSIAAEADVDLALISYYFGSKKGLFGAALALSANPADILTRAMEGDLFTLPQRALHDLLATWEDPDAGAPLRALLAGAVQDEALAHLVKEMLEREIVDKIAARIGGADARQRATTFCAQVAGLIVTRYILRLEPLTSMSPDEIVRTIGPRLQLVRRPAAIDRPRGRTIPQPAAE